MGASDAFHSRDDIRVISADELKAKLDRGDHIRLVNALRDWEFNAKHIPGSEHFSNFEDVLKALKPDDEIVVYCTDPPCRASQKMYWDLIDRGFSNVRRFAGGLVEWDAAGYPFEGDAV
jgi:rhodanese-related sulfurtransferase